MIPMQKLIYFLTAFLISLSCHAAGGLWGKNNLDLQTFNELNNQAIQIWTQIAKESGPTAATSNFLSAQTLDPRIVNFHEVVLQFLGTSSVHGALGTVVQLSETNEMQDALTAPFSPFFRQVLLNIAIVRSIQMYERGTGFFSVMPESSFNHSIWCVIADRCAEGLAPKYARTDATYRTWVRQYMIAKYLMDANFKDICATYLDGRHTVGSLRALRAYSFDEVQGTWGLSLAKPATNVWNKLVPCIIEKSGGFQNRPQTNGEEEIESAKKYLRGL
jgi:hypothetical protein